MVLRKTPYSRANALTFIEVPFDFGVGSGRMSVILERGLVPSGFSAVAVTRNAVGPSRLLQVTRSAPSHRPSAVNGLFGSSRTFQSSIYETRNCSLDRFGILTLLILQQSHTYEVLNFSYV
jgi:hypothetical protein